MISSRGVSQQFCYDTAIMQRLAAAPRNHAETHGICFLRNANAVIDPLFHAVPQPESN